MREQRKKIFNTDYCLQEDKLKSRDLILLHDTKRFQSQKIINKLVYKWLRPYKIQKANNLKETYFLAELEGTTISGSIAGNRLKRFHSQHLLTPNSKIESLSGLHITGISKSCHWYDHWIPLLRVSVSPYLFVLLTLWLEEEGYYNWAILLATTMTSNVQTAVGISLSTPITSNQSDRRNI